MDVAQQIDTGVLVCPKTKQKLHVNGRGDWLENSDKTERYPFAGGNVPVLLLDNEWAQKYVGSSQNIAREYSPQALSSLVAKMKQALIHDYRTTASKKAFLFTLMQMGATFIRYYLPRPFNQIFRFAWSPLGMVIRPLDKILGKTKNAYIMASTTYAVIEKP